MQTPLVSVILPTYHWPSVLRYAIKTVLWQTFTDFELIIVGDGCEDSTEMEVKEFHDPRILWINLPEHSGNQAAPNNAGLALARGKYIAYMHHDDLWLPNHLMTLVGKFSSVLSLAHTLCLQISLTSHHTAERIRLVMGLPNTGFCGPEKRAIYTVSIMHTIEKAKQIGGWRDWKTLHKTTFTDFIERLSETGEQIYSIPEITVLKFNSAERLYSYVEKPCHEQATYFERIQREPDFLYRELLLAIENMMLGKQVIQVLPTRQGDEPPGWEIAEYRHLRGLKKMI